MSMYRRRHRSPDRRAALYPGQSNAATVMYQTWNGSPDDEPIIPTFTSYAVDGYQSNGIIFSVILARLMLFSEAELKWQRYGDGKLYGDRRLGLLEKPWPNGSTGELFARMEQDVSLAGNAFVRNVDDERLCRLRPDLVTIVSELATDDWGRDYRRLIGYGWRSESGEILYFDKDEVAHWSPIPDPMANFRGMSWLTPIVREIDADTELTRYKIKYLQNAAPQPLDAKVLTPAGWTTMGVLAVGDRVIGADGKPREITGVFPQGERQIFRATWSDGTSTECTDDHVWAVANYHDLRIGKTRTMSLGEMVESGLHYESKPGAEKSFRQPKWATVMVDPVEFDGDDSPLPVDPYLLGLLLGDGSFRSNGKGSGGVSLAMARDDVEETLAGLVLPAGVTASVRDRGGWSEAYFRGEGAPRPNPLTEAIKTLGLWDHPGADKFVPERYLLGSVSDRVAVLQGLVDSDGSVDRRQPNLVRVTTTSRRLADDLAFLIGSLGGISTIALNSKTAGRPQWTVTVRRLPEWITPARLARKADRYVPYANRRIRWLVSVEPVGVKEAQCIRVDSEDHLYVTDDFVVTHNTPNMIVRHPEELEKDTINDLRDRIQARYGGVDNAFKTLVLDSGADVSVVGTNFKDLEMSLVQAAGENRIATAGGVPAIVVGLKEGLEAATYSNYQTAMRRFSDITMRPNWRTACSALETIVPPAPDSRLWFDPAKIAALREGEKERADIVKQKALALESLVRSGFDPTSAASAMEHGDFSQMQHSGMLSVQLQPPGTTEAVTTGESE